MAHEEEHIIRDTVRTFRQKCVEREWDNLDFPDASRYDALWRALDEVGATSLALGEGDDEMAISPRARFNLFRELGSAVPALGVGLIAHHAARTLLSEALGKNERPAWVNDAMGARLALVASPLDKVPEGRFEIHTNGVVQLSGAARVAMPFPDWIALHAVEGGRDRMVLLPRKTPGLHFVQETSSHGLRLIPFGNLHCSRLEVERDRVFDWPASGRAAREADGQMTSLLTGMVGEMVERAMAYALQRYQGGKMIHEHDAVRDLVGPMLVALPSLEALAVATLESNAAGDGGASAFAVEIARTSGIAAIQVFGGYGYMEDYRVERYARDANTFETFWIHSASRRRSIAAQQFTRLSAQETS